MAKLKEGDRAPDFCLKGLDERGEEKEICLGDLLKRGPLVLYFYPKDDTPGCTQEACDFRDNLERLVSKGYQVVGVSPDSVESHRKFRQKYNLNFPLLSDPENKVSSMYGAYGKKKMYGKEVEGIIRSTFVIDTSGVIKKAYYNVKAKGHVEKLLSEI